MLAGVHGDDGLFHTMLADDLPKLVPFAQARQTHRGEQLIPPVHVHKAHEPIAR